MSGPLLVVAHEAQRNGAPRVLLELLGRAKPALDVTIRMEIRRDGPLAPDLLALADDRDLTRPPAAVLVNSAQGVGAMAALDPRTPALVYVHEESEALSQLSTEDRELLTGRATRVLCVSRRSQEALVALGVPRDRIALLAPVIGASVPDAAAVQRVRSTLAGDDGELLLGCGEASWRKGTDLFVPLARALATRPKLHLAWVGRRHRSFARVLDHDTRLLGLADRLTWLGEVDDPMPYLAAADLVVCPSREDPQPLVPLEAALVGTATAGFGGTGMDDLAHEGAARVAPYPDLAALAALVGGLLDDPDGRSRVVDGARAIAGRRSPEAMVPVFVRELQALLASAG